MIRYTSLLIRIWKSSEQDPDHCPTGWQAEVEQIQTSRCLTFDSPEALIIHFEQYVQHNEDWVMDSTPDPQMKE
jgi:hypothetical protein